LSSLSSLDAVVNTSSLSSFIVTDTVDLVKYCFRRIYVPEAVAKELRLSPYTLPQGLQMRRLQAVQRKEAHGIGFGPGENEAIVLARDLDLPLMMDETDARKAAKRFGLKVYSSLLLVRLAFESCLIQREEYERKIHEFEVNSRANVEQVNWARTAQKTK
jgi:predicted nucleic acid-binding protein